MRKLLLLAEEGERKLIREVGDRLGIESLLAEYEVLITGVGALNVLRALRDVPRDTEVLNIGYAGSANFEVGSLVEVTEVCLNHPNVTYPEPEMHLLTGGELIPADSYRSESCQEPARLLQARCYTNTDFVLRSDYRDCVFDMELAFIAGMGFTRLRAIKHVSDNLSLHAYHEITNGVE
ncbi:MAG: hypothetical protein ACI4BD_06325 [Paludibacteraceae bacterium]